MGVDAEIGLRNGTTGTGSALLEKAEISPFRVGVGAKNVSLGIRNGNRPFVAFLLNGGQIVMESRGKVILPVGAKPFSLDFS